MLKHLYQVIAVEIYITGNVIQLLQSQMIKLQVGNIMEINVELVMMVSGERCVNICKNL